MQLIPELLRRRGTIARRFKFVPCRRQRAADRAHTAGQNTKEMQAPGHCPSTEIATACRAPIVTGETCSGCTYQACGLDYSCRTDAAFCFGKLGCVLCIEVLECRDEILKCDRNADTLVRKA